MIEIFVCFSRSRFGRWPKLHVIEISRDCVEVKNYLIAIIEIWCNLNSIKNEEISMIEIWIRKYQKSLKRRLKFCMIEIVLIQILMEGLEISIIEIWKTKFRSRLSKFEIQTLPRKMINHLWSLFCFFKTDSSFSWVIILQVYFF